jgi:phage baseplate assembly protein gpV
LLPDPRIEPQAFWVSASACVLQFDDGACYFYARQLTSNATPGMKIGDVLHINALNIMAVDLARQPVAGSA